jgi:hypothetical protein
VPGAFRPYTLTDVLGALQQQAIGNTDTSVSGVGYFAEADETVPMADSVTMTVAAPATWDNGVWGGFSWG